MPTFLEWHFKINTLQKRCGFKYSLSGRSPWEPMMFYLQFLCLLLCAAVTCSIASPNQTSEYLMKDGKPGNKANLIDHSMTLEEETDNQENILSKVFARIIRGSAWCLIAGREGSVIFEKALSELRKFTQLNTLNIIMMISIDNRVCTISVVLRVVYKKREATCIFISVSLSSA